MKKISVRSLVPIAIFILALSIFFNACEEPDDLGLNIQPPSDKLGIFFSDTTTVFAHTFIEDSVVTDELPTNLLGNYMDPVFGNVDASFFTQVRLSSNNVTFGTNPVADSLVLSFVYSGSYGDITSPMYVKIFEATESFYKDSTYYSNQTVNYNPAPLANITVVPNPTDSVVVNGTTLVPQLRIKLNNSLATKFLTASSTDLADNDAFLKFFKGFYVKSEAKGRKGCLMYFNLPHAQSKLTLYYHNDDDTVAYPLLINENCATFNIYDHKKYSNATATLLNQVNGDTLLGENQLYVQAMMGLRVKLTFPYLQNWNTNQKIAVNKATFIVPADENDPNITKYVPPARLGLVKISTAGKASFLSDYFLGTSYFGGYYDSDSKLYTFNITKYTQQMLLGTETEGNLNLLADSRQISANRVVLAGTKSTGRKMRLELIYTVLD